MNRRQSTNYKLSAIINANTNTDAQSEINYKNQEKKAKQRLLRACLYGGGARIKLPRTRRSKKNAWSPFAVAGGAPDEAPPKQLSDSIPPGAHNDLYRIVTNPTRRSAEDPDRIFLNSQTMLPGVKHFPQPPWYVGYNNYVVPPDVNPMTAAARYGFRGSKNIHEHNVKPYALPTDTLTDHTPKFLQLHSKNQEYVDEYVPPILATKFNTINGMESPKMWPENTEYVTGFPKKKLPTLWKYKRETTVHLSERPKSPKTLSMVHSKSLEQSQMLSDYARMESQKSFLSLPITSQMKFETEWNDVVKEEASRPLKYSLHRIGSTTTSSSSSVAGSGHHEERSLLDPSDTMRYTGTTALIIHTKSTDELKFRLRMEKTKAKVHTPFTLKWQHVIGHFENINDQLKKHQPMIDAIEKIAIALQQTAIQNGSQTSLKRIEFIQSCSLIHYFEGISEKQFSQLYSIFDPMKKNSMRFVEFIFCLLVLDRPESLPLPKLQVLWEYANQYGLDRNIFDIAFDVLSCCVGSYYDLQTMERLFRDVFRPKCYEYAVQEKRGSDEAAALSQELNQMTNIYDDSGSNPFNLNANANANPNNPNNNPNKLTSGKGSNRMDSLRSVSMSPSMLSQPSSPKPLSPRNTVNNNSNNVATAATNKSASLSSSSYLQHQYNICEHYLNSQTFALVLQDCPEIVELFDQQLSAKLKLCYGKDDRYKKPEEEFVPTENLDFTWIIKKPPPMKASFGLFEEQEQV